MKKSLVGLVLSGVLLAACGGAQKSTDPETSTVVTEPDEAPPPMPPEAKLDEGKCNQAIDHAIALMEANEGAREFVAQMQENRAQLVKDCTESATQADYDCLMAAKIFDDLGKCEDPGAD